MEQEKPSFEEALDRLRCIVEGMEEGSLPLEEMIKRYEQGIALADLCSKSLRAAEERVRVIAEATGDELKLELWDKESPSSNQDNEEEID